MYRSVLIGGMVGMAVTVGAGQALADSESPPSQATNSKCEAAQENNTEGVLDSTMCRQFFGEEATPQDDTPSPESVPTEQKEFEYFFEYNYETGEWEHGFREKGSGA